MAREWRQLDCNYQQIADTVRRAEEDGFELHDVYPVQLGDASAGSLETHFVVLSSKKSTKPGQASFH